MIIDNIGGALSHWLGFQEKIGRSFMMNEDALKYPVADYLTNEGNIAIKSIELEHQHPNFSSRLTDLAIIDVNNPQIIKNIFEFKLATSTTRYASEKQRIFDDLIRLYLGNVVATDKCYFLIAGKSVHFQRDFRDFTENTKRFYTKWFSFVKGQTATFTVLTETDAAYANIYSKFLDKYSHNFQNTVPVLTTTLALPNQITTKCEFITAFTTGFVPYMAGIWSVS